MKDYGLRVYRHGVEFHSDGRLRGRAGGGREFFVSGMEPWHGRRSPVVGFSAASRRRLAFVAANAVGAFKAHVTLTYHAVSEEWESDAEKNARIVRRAKADLNRFLTCQRARLGEYLWVQEFQKRGVVHFHMLCENAVEETQLKVAWLRAIGSLDDRAAMRHGARVQAVGGEGDRRTRANLGRYIGKAKQKALPPGVECAGRWWGRSRGLALVPLDEVVSCEAGSTRPNRVNIRIGRFVRKYLSRRFGWKFRGGSFVDWRGELSGCVRRVVGELRGFYGVEPVITVVPVGCGEKDGVCHVGA